MFTNIIVAAAAIMTVNATPVETTAPVAYDVPAVVETVEYEIPEIDVVLSEESHSLEDLDAAAVENGFDVSVDEDETVRVYARTLETDSYRILVYEKSVFVSYVDLTNPEVLDAGYAFSSVLEDDVLTCEDGFDVLSILTASVETETA